MRKYCIYTPRYNKLYIFQLNTIVTHVAIVYIVMFPAIALHFKVRTGLSMRKHTYCAGIGTDSNREILVRISKYKPINSLTKYVQDSKQEIIVRVRQTL